MRSISPSLAAAQSVRSPKATVTVSLSARGQNAEAPALEWSELVAPASVATLHPAAGCAMEDGAVLRFVGAPSSLRVQRITDPTDAGQWQNNGWTTLQSVTADAIAAYHSVGVYARVYYIANGNVYYMLTSDQGLTWGAPVSVYAGADAAFDVCARRVPITHTIGANHIHGFTTYNSGTYAAYFDVGTPVKYANGWRAAGVYVRDSDPDHVYCLVFSAPDSGPARLRVLRFDGATFDQPVDIDQTQAGLFGLNLSGYRFCASSSGGTLLGIASENAYMGGNYEGVAGLFWNEGVQADEPIMFPDIVSYGDRIYSYLVQQNDDYYYFGETFVYHGAVQPASAATITPIRYSYNDHQIELMLPTDAATIRPGQILTVRRTLSWGEDSGSEEMAFYTARVMRTRMAMVVIGVDAVGFLGIARCRRPAVISDGAADGLAQVIRRLAARFGLVVECDDGGLENADVMPMTLQPSESLLGAVYRATSQTNAWLVPSNDGTFSATLINPGSSDSGDYDDTPHLYPNGEWALIDAAGVADYRRLAFAYVLGTYSTDPNDGAFVGMAQGPALPNTRPLSYSLTNTRYNTDERVEKAAHAEARRQHKLTVDALIEAPANLALELHDCVTVTEPSLGWNERTLRVRRIREVWADGRLTQTLYLGNE